MPYRVLMFLIPVLLLAACTGAQAATPSGVSIVNQATISYVDSASNTPITVRSNISRVDVSELKRFALTQPLRIAAADGSLVLLSHQLHNTGNVPDTYVLDARNQNDDQGHLIQLTLYVDNNGNGVIDPDDTEVSGVQTLQPDEVRNLILAGRLATDVLKGATTRVVLEAHSVDIALSPQKITDEILTSDSASLSLLMQGTEECTVPVNRSKPLEYQVTIGNDSSSIPAVRAFTVDGVDTEGFLLQLDIPPELHLDSQKPPLTSTTQASIVVKASANTGHWTSYSQWTGQPPVDALGLLLPADVFTHSRSVTLNFTAAANPDTDAQRVELNATIDLYGDGQTVLRSNSVCNTLTPLFEPEAAQPVNASIRFIEPATSLQRLDTLPEFAADDQFSKAPVYQLAESTSSYRVAMDGVYVEMTATLPAAHVLSDANGTRYVVVDVSSQATNDTLKVLLQETQPGSQRYRSVRPVRLDSTPGVRGGYCPGTSSAARITHADFQTDTPECALSSRSNDSLSVRFSLPDASISVKDTATVDPVSRVFDSGTLSGISGATVTILSAGQVALHPVSGVPLTFQTDERGRYRLPRLEPGIDYSIHVEPPAGYQFASLRGPDQFTDVDVGPYAYGSDGFNNAGNGQFVIAPFQATPVINIPLDRVDNSSQLRIEKSTSAVVIEPGDVLDYRIVVSNDNDSEVSELTIVDTPPHGFRYLAGSARLNAQATDDPSPARRRANDKASDGLGFELPPLAAGDSHQISYRMQATAAAVDGDGVNVAVASGLNADGAVVASQISRVGVDIRRSGILSGDAIVFGKVYVDSSCDGLQNQGEWPIAGVRLYLQDGTVVTTDEDGQYSLYALKPGLHVIKLDAETLPEGLLLKPLDNRHAADPDSRFMDLSEGDFHRADFATHCPRGNPDAVFKQLAERSKALRGSWRLDDQSGKQAQLRALDSDNRDTGHPSPDAQADTTNQTDNAADDNEEELMGDAKALVSMITREQAKSGTWLWPTDEFSTDGRFMAVVRSGLEPILYVNDVEVSGEQIGERLINRTQDAEIIAWYGVSLKPGINSVQVRARDSFGNERVLANADFKRPAAATRITLRAKQITLPADGGKSALPIDILLTDANGYPASGVYFVTLNTSAGHLMESDLQPGEPGIQRRVENGFGKVHLQSSDKTGELRMVAQAGTLTTSMNFVQVAASRPLIGAGLIELGGRWGEVDNHDEAVGNIEHGFTTEARAALFLKGHIKKDLQLTLAYDTDKRRDDINVLRDPEVQDNYVVRGDASNASVETQSRSKLYMKLERDRHSVLWGDYVTDTQTDPIDLARVQKTLTGLKGVYDDGTTRVEAFAAEQSDARASEEIRGNGTSMLFSLSDAPIVTNSEVIELIVRSRDNPGLVLSSRPLVRYSDYTIDPISGLLSFSNTIPSVDSDLNPVSLRITYDRVSNLDEHLVSGARITHRLNDAVNLGASLTEDENPVTGNKVAGLYASVTPSANTSISIAAARQTHQNQQADGHAQRFQLEHRWSQRPAHQTSLVWAHADEGFTNTGAGIAAGRDEWRLTHTQPFTNTLQATAEAIHSESLSENTRFTSTGLAFDKSLKTWTLRAGARRIEYDNAQDRDRFHTGLLGIEKRVRFGSRDGSVGIDYEQDINDSTRYELGAGLQAQLHEHVDFFTRYSYERGLSPDTLLGTRQGSTQLAIGVQSDVLASTELYSEYRMRGSFSGRNMEAVSGAKARFEPKPGLSINPAAEVIHALGGDNVEDAVALSLGVSDTRNPNRRVSGQAEVRRTDSTRYLGLRTTVAQRLNVDWTALVREELTHQTPRVGEMTLRHRLTTGVALRPKRHNRHHMLLLARWQEELGPADGADRSTYVLSNHHNRQLHKRLTLSGRLAGKWQKTRYADNDAVAQARLIDGRLSYDINRRWEMDVRGGWLGIRDFSGGRFSFGAGIHWLVDRNLRMSLGYNVIGFRDEDLDEQNYNAKGIHVGLQMKFDEDWFQWLAFDK